jgi:hypothetical protein
MGHKPLRFRKAPTVFLGVTSMLCVATPLHARATAVPGKPAQTEDASRREIDNFNRFLESHHDVAVQLHSTPWLVDNYNYLQSHPELKAYLQDHPGVKQEISQNPVAFMKEDSQRSELAQFARFLDTHREVGEQLRNDPMLADNSNFLRSHPELRGYLDEHPAVKQALHENAVTFMQEEDGFNRYAGRGDRDADARNGDTDRDRDANSNGRDRDADARNRDADKRAPDADARDRDADARNGDADRDRDANSNGRDRDADARNRDADKRGPDADDRDRDAYARNGDADRDRDADARNRDADKRAPDADDHDRETSRRNLADFDRFLDGHREIAEQVRKDPSLTDNREFVQHHPALQTFLENNPGVRDDLKRDPNAFMHQEDRFDRAENGGGNRDAMHNHMADFGGFLGDHRDIARDLNRDPEAVKNKEFVQNRPDLDSYLNAHPDVRSDLMANPQNFVKGAQQISSGSSNGSGISGSGSGSTGATGTTGTAPAGSKSPSGSGETPAPAPKTKQ